MSLREALAALMKPRSGAQAVEYFGSPFRDMVLGLTPEELYRTQPDLRTVISFVARNVAHLGVPVYARRGDNDRERLSDDPLALLFKSPNDSMTRYELINTLVSDLGLHDRAYWLLTRDDKRKSGWNLQPIPPSWVVGQKSEGAFSVAEYVVARPGSQRMTIPAKNMIVFHGWNPSSLNTGTSPVETLRAILAEQIHAWEHRNQVWERGGRASAVLTRPAGAPWSDTARDRFMSEWKQRWTGSGGSAGGTPILEDGMTLNKLSFSAREDEWSEVSKVALAKVAAIYHVTPAMLGAAESSSFASMKEHRKMLYSETLGPTLAMIEDRINAFLAPVVSATENAYVEFNIQEKLQGDFEEQAQILSTSVGGPWMNRNEARARINLPPIEGGDELITPLNVLLGGQASPQDGVTGKADLEALQTLSLLSAFKRPLALEAKSPEPKLVKAASAEGDDAELADVLRAFFARQRKSVLSELGSKSPGWWNAERWLNELVADLLPKTETMVTAAARAMLEGVGVDPDGYNPERVKSFLRAALIKRGEKINETTLDQLEAILAGEGPEGVTEPAHVFDLAERSRADGIGATLAAFIAGFATVEAAKQTGASSKQWLTTSSSPRASHAAMHGESVPVGEKFSNGADWPGDQALGIDGIAGCMCEVVVTYA